ncbi:hypothetical protein D3C80_1969090 [compost metagenome]
MEDDGLARIFVRQDHRLPGGGSKDCHEARQGRRSIASRDFPRIEVKLDLVSAEKVGVEEHPVEIDGKQAVTAIKDVSYVSR